MPVRGKILNCLKADYGKIFKSEIITDLLKVMGCGVEVNDKHNKDLSLFNLANLRWNKIVICTDADVDGLSDPYPHPHHALAAGPHPDPGGVCLHRRVPPV